MKKILCFMLVIVVMASISVPAFATDSTYPDITQVPHYSDTHPYLVIVHGTNDIGNTFVTYYLSDTPSVVRDNSLCFDGYAYLYSLTNNRWVFNEFYNPGYFMSISMDFVDYYYANHNVIDSSTSNIVHSADDFTQFIPICDGSSCSASDRNFDDICDFCGYTLAYNLRVTPQIYEFIIKHSDSLTLKYTYTETLDGTVMNAVYSDDRVTVSFDNPVNHYQYKLVGDEWEEYASYPNTYGSHAMSLPDTSTILSSNLVVYDENGEVFFRNPLWMVTGQVVQGEMENLTAETGGTMKVLTLCGVGLIALLVVLSLFGRRSLIFLKR